MQDYADIAGIEFLRITAETTIASFRRELKSNEACS
jgi:L-arabinose isomerase